MAQRTHTHTHTHPHRQTDRRRMSNTISTHYAAAKAIKTTNDNERSKITIIERQRRKKTKGCNATEQRQRRERKKIWDKRNRRERQWEDSRKEDRRVRIPAIQTTNHSLETSLSRKAVWATKTNSSWNETRCGKTQCDSSSGTFYWYHTFVVICQKCHYHGK